LIHIKKQKYEYLEMSASSIINSATGKLFADLIPGGGGTEFTQEGQLIYGGQAPDFADQLLNIGNAGQILGVAGGIPAWQDAGGSGLITANLPIIEDADPAPNSKISINFSNAIVGEIPYGTGVAKVGALTNAPQAGQILGVAGGVPAWINAGGSGTVTALAPLTEYADGTASKVAIDFTAKGDLVVGGGVQVGGQPVAGVILPVGANDYVLTANSNEPSGLEWKASGGGSSATIFRDSQDNSTGYIAQIQKPATANDTCIVVADRTFHAYNSQVKNTPSTAGTLVDTTVQNGITFFTFTAPADLTVTGISGQIYLENTAQFPQQTPNTGTMTMFNQAQTVALIESDEMDWLNSGNFNVNFTADVTQSPTNLVSGQVVIFNFSVDNLAPQTLTCDAVDTGGGAISGNLTITGTEFAGLPVKFEITPNTSKFKETNDLAGKSFATCANFSSQLFVASGDLEDWIVVGGINAGVTIIN